MNIIQLNKNIISEFINTFWDDKINEIIQKYKIFSISDINKVILKGILQENDLIPIIKAYNSKEKNFREKINDIDFYEIDVSSIKETFYIFNYPKNLTFLDELLFSKLLHFLNLPNYEYKKAKAKISLNFNFGNIAFRSEDSFFLNNKSDLIYVYTMDHNQKKEICFNLVLILSFTNHFDFINNFKKIISTNIRYNSLHSAIIFENQYKLKIHLNYYENLKSILENMNRNERKLSTQSKNLLYLLKHLPDNIFKELIEKGEEIKKIEKKLSEPDTETLYMKQEQEPKNYKDFKIDEPDNKNQFFYKSK